MKLLKLGIILAMVVSLKAECLGQQNNETVKIPKGVNYKYAKTAENEVAKEVLEKALEKAEDIKPEKLFCEATICGPLMWEQIKPSNSDILNKAKLAMAVINSSILKEGRRLITIEEKKEFWEVFNRVIVNKQKYNIRKATSKEIIYYWATIPFDITEPFYIIDFGNLQVLVDFELEGNQEKIFWIDVVGDLDTIH